MLKAFSTRFYFVGFDEISELLTGLFTVTAAGRMWGQRLISSVNTEPTFCNDWCTLFKRSFLTHNMIRPAMKGFPTDCLFPCCKTFDEQRLIVKKNTWL